MKRSWRVSSGPKRLLIELGAPSASPADRDAAWCLRGFLHHAQVSPGGEADRALVEVYTELFGAMPSSWHGGRADLGRRMTIFDGIERELARALERGALRVLDDRTRSVVIPLEGTLDAPLGPDADDAPPPSKTWIGLTLVDQDGTPVPDRGYRVVRPDGTTVDGTLDSNGSVILKDLDPGNCQIWCPYVEPHPELAYTAQDGDHLSGVAETYGFDDYTVVWNDPANADLRALRGDPHVLAPGDAITVPALASQPAAGKPTGAKHPFTIQRSPLKLRLTLYALTMKPAANVPVTIADAATTTDGDGKVETPVGKTIQHVAMTWAGTDLDLRVGGLNPSDDATEAGYKARLVNMGFLWDGMADDDEDEMIVALQDFQAEYALPISGKLDDATKTQLLQSYGC